MKCDQARDMLYDEPGSLRRALLWAHLRLCQACRAEVRQVRTLDDALAALPRFSPPPELLPNVLAKLPQPDSALAARKERGRMRRLAYAGVVILAIAVGIGLIIPGRWNKPNAESILMGVADAMEKAESVYVVYGTGPVVANKSSQELHGSHFRNELWLSDRAVYQGSVAPDRTVLDVSAVSVDTLEWRVCQGDMSHEADRTPDGRIIERYRLIHPTLYVADLTPIAAEATKFVSSKAQVFFSGEWSRVLGSEHLINPEQSVAIETRQGRRVAIVTVTGGHRVVLVKRGQEDRQAIGTARNVFEVDLETNHLLSMRRYLQAEGFPEGLVAATHKIEYDVPVPAHLAAMRDAAKVVEATATIEQAGNIVRLIMRADGREIDRMYAARE